MKINYQILKTELLNFTICIILITYSTTNWAKNSLNLSYSPKMGKEILNIPSYTISGTIENCISQQIDNEINFVNPAANKDIEYTTLNLNTQFNLYKLRRSNKIFWENSDNNSFSSLSIGFPITKKVFFGIGFYPYEKEKYEKDNNQQENIYLNSFLDGKIHSLNTITSYSINNNLNIGLRISYLFGSINNATKIYSEKTKLITHINKIYHFSGIKFRPGILFSKKILDHKYKINLGATIDLSSKLNTWLSFLQSDFYFNTINNKKQFEEIIVDSYRCYYTLEKSLPKDYSIGLSIGIDKNWMIGVEFLGENPSNISSNKNLFFKKRNRLSLTGWMIPNEKYNNNYLSKITYRFGTYYEHSRPLEYDKFINQVGIKLGCSLPIKKNIKPTSMINIKFEMGRKSFFDMKFHKNNFANIEINFNLSDDWFKKALIS